MSNNSSNLCAALLRHVLPLALCLCLPATLAAGQQQLANKTDEQLAKENRAEQIVARAVAAMGGDAYLGVRSTIGRGIITPFAKGQSQLPLSFTDYLVFPDKERTEFRGGGNRSIDTFVGASGWGFDAAQRSIKDKLPADVESFQVSLRTSLDNLLRGWWRKDGATLTYVGRREAGLARRNETVRLTYPDGFTVDFEIGAKDNLPAKALYKRTNSEGTEVREEDRYARFLTFNGITLPFIIDHYRAGDQTSRISYDIIEFNRPIADALFAKPANIKALK
ncbi:MAG TPA: hypothetical protein VF525_07585 [Pyrinomonadaceae bacterium]|jgi:hypothetical protein